MPELTDLYILEIRDKDSRLFERKELGDGEILRIGRGEGKWYRNDIRLPLDQRHISRNHCSISRTASQCTLMDEGSAWGTRWNGLKITEAVCLSSEDVISLPDGWTLKFLEERRPVEANGPLAENAIVASRYKILGLLGAGNMGMVYKVKDLRSSGEEEYALKISRKASSDFLETAKLAVELTARTQNSFLVPHLACGHDDFGNLDYVVMRYIRGESLEHLRRKLKYFAEDECLVVADGICRALDALEKSHILHGDIKPANIMVNGDGVLQLADFGIAMKIEAHETEKEGNGGKVPKMGSIVYASPEQLIRHTDINNKADIYSLGATLYELASGQHPFHGNSLEQVWKFRLKHPVPPLPPHKLNAAISRKFSALIMKMMRTEIELRPESCQELLHELKTLGCPAEYERRLQIMKNLLTRDRVISTDDADRQIPNSRKCIRRAFFVVLGLLLALAAVVIFFMD